MHITRIQVVNFRNIREAEITPGGGVNLLVGRNAQGKTSFLEAVNFLAETKSPRTSSHADLVSFDAETSNLSAKAVAGGRRLELSVAFDRNSGRKLKLNGVEPAGISEYIGNLITVYFCPADMELVSGPPGGRRRALDVLLAETDKKYLYGLRAYYKILKQKNALLAEIRAGRSGGEGLDEWDIQLAGSGAEIIRSRHAAVESLSPEFKSVNLEISGGRETAGAEYATVPGVAPGKMGEGEIKDALIGEMRRKRPLELHLGISLAGPHRDDAVLTLDGREAKKYASFGQQKMMSLSLKTAFARYIKSKTGETPVMLLDDLFSEFDEARLGDLMKMLAGEKGQMFIAALDEKQSSPAEKIFSVEGGKIIEKQEHRA